MATQLLREWHVYYKAANADSWLGSLQSLANKGVNQFVTSYLVR